MNSQKRIQSEIARWARVISLIGLVGLLLLAGITVGEVLLRWLFNYPIMGVYDVSRLVVTIVVAACMPMVCAENRHITVRLVGSLLGSRVNALLEAFGALVATGIVGVLAWQLWIYTNELVAGNETTMMVLWPVAPWWRIATILVMLCIPIQLVYFWFFLKLAFAPQTHANEKAEVISEDSGKDIFK
jgi:TRAP-type transport system small permease protein